MHNLSLFISSLLAQILFRVPEVVLVKEEIIVDRLDKRGLVATDLLFIKRHNPPVIWKDGMSLEKVAWQQGQNDMVRFIETKVIGRRLDGQPTSIQS